MHVLQDGRDSEMKTFRRVCLHDHTVVEGDKSFALKRGTDYLTSREEDGVITVFTGPYWIACVPVEWFGGSVPGA